MNIKRIKTQKFVGHESMELDIPERGVVLITGPNGSGKSSFVEAGPVAVFGKTLRGTNPWNGKKGFAEIEVGDYTIRRTRKGARSEVSVVGGPAFDTAAKAGDWLTSTFGSFETWRRTHVFSAQDAAHFTTATDGERKKLLEQLLGLGHFDTAHILCRKDMREAEKKFTAAEHSAQLLQARVDQSLAERRRIQEQLADLPDATPPHGKTATARVPTAELEEEIRTVRKALRAAEAVVADTRSAVNVSRQKMANLDHDECYTCGQDIPGGLKATAKAEIAATEALHREAEEQTQAVVTSLEQREGQIRQELREIQASEAEQASAIAAAGRSARLRQRMEEQLAGLGTTIRENYDKLEELEDTLDSASTEVQLLKACERALGLTGVRAHVLGKTLKGIEAVANVWLAQIAGHGMSLSLSPYKEKKKGGVTDAISLEISGAGGGFGYKASSGGERRRIDVALLLALADIASAATGGGGGTLFMDEVFDSLDGEGVEATIAALEDLSSERAVVIISHNEYLAERLSPVQHVKLG